MSVTAKDVQEAADYLADGGIGEVMGMVHATKADRVVSDKAMIIALCVMATSHLNQRDLGTKQPVRMNFGDRYGRSQTQT